MWTDDERVLSVAELEWDRVGPRGTLTNCFGWLPDVLQQEIVGLLSCPGDCGALCVAMPRLGLVALRQLPQFRDPLVSVAMRLATDEPVIDEALMRRYLWDQRMTSDGCEWLTAAAQSAGSTLGIVLRYEGILPGENHVGLHGPILDAGVHTLRCMTGGALVRREMPDGVIALYEGEAGEERAVRERWPVGSVTFYEGESGAERRVREEQPHNGLVFFYESGTARLLRLESSDGNVEHFEGERDAERLVRLDCSSGSVQFYEGEQDLVQQRTRRIWSVQFYEGEQDAERMVRKTLEGGKVIHYEGERHVEQILRVSWECDGCAESFEDDETDTFVLTQCALCAKGLCHDCWPVENCSLCDSGPEGERVLACPSCRLTATCTCNVRLECEECDPDHETRFCLLHDSDVMLHEECFEEVMEHHASSHACCTLPNPPTYRCCGAPAQARPWVTTKTTCGRCVSADQKRIPHFFEQLTH